VARRVAPRPCQKVTSSGGSGGSGEGGQGHGASATTATKSGVRGPAPAASRVGEKRRSRGSGRRSAVGGACRGSRHTRGGGGGRGGGGAGRTPQPSHHKQGTAAAFGRLPRGRAAAAPRQRPPPRGGRRLPRQPPHARPRRGKGGGERGATATAVSPRSGHRGRHWAPAAWASSGGAAAATAASRVGEQRRRRGSGGRPAAGGARCGSGDTRSGDGGRGVEERGAGALAFSPRTRHSGRHRAPAAWASSGGAAAAAVSRLQVRRPLQSTRGRRRGGRGADCNRIRWGRTAAWGNGGEQGTRRRTLATWWGAQRDAGARRDAARRGS